MKTPDVPNPSDLAGRLGSAPSDALGFVRRAAATGRNAAELARYGGMKVDEESSPYQVVADRPVFKLRRYFPDSVPTGLPALVLVPPLMMMADLFDVAPRSSSVRAVHEAGVDVWVVDFGRPENEPGGLQRTVADHVLAVSDAIDVAREATGLDIVLGGYSQGGMFSYQAAAYRRGEGIDSIVAFGAPVDFRSAPMPIPISAESYGSIAEGLLRTGLVEHLTLPSWFNRSATRMLDPVKSAQFRLQYLRQLHDREKLLPGEQQRKFLDRGGWTAYAGPAFADLLRYSIITNRMLEGGLVIADRTVSLADLDLPILIVVGDIDREGHPRSVRAIRDAAPRADIYELTLHTGHFGIVAGSGSRRLTWPRVADWIRWRAGQGDLPAVIVPENEVTHTREWTPGAMARRAQDVADLSVGVSRTAYGAASGAANLLYSLARERAAQVPLLNRLDALRPGTAISLGLLLDEAAKRDPEGIALLFGDRVIRQREVKHRVDSVVKGLLGLGVRPGDPVGILMSSRPSAFSVIAALSRLGATSVLLRPDGPLGIETTLGAVSIVISDPDHVEAARTLPGVRWCVLGGGSEERELPEHVVDMERIDPDKVSVPLWFRPNPTRAADTAFVLFTGTGDRTRARVISNGRWVLSALGTASAAALKPTHTVYSVTPLHHSSALLMAVGGAVAAGSRLALASGSDPETFWAEVRRYGATHVSYTWTSLRGITDGPPHPNERHHPIRLFIGSGMPRGLWKRVRERFAPAQVLEFYASADGDAILANVAGVKVGAAGRPVPGTADVKIVAYDAGTGRLAYGPDGLARECHVDEPGLLLARHDRLAPAQDTLRTVFRPDDAWQSTGDLFARDAEGDFWLLDAADALIRTADGPVPPSRVANALTSIPRVDLAVAYGVPDGDRDVVVAAVSLFPGAELGDWDLQSALRELAPTQRPRFVRVVDTIPLTTWSRPQSGPLEEEGLPTAGSGKAVWRLKADGETYELLT